jgi:hypothetical protein
MKDLNEDLPAHWNKESLLHKWKQIGVYDFSLLNEDQQLALSIHLEKGIFALNGQPSNVVIESLKKRCLEWIHRNSITEVPNET